LVMGTKMFRSFIAYSLLRYRGACALVWPERLALRPAGSVQLKTRGKERGGSVSYAFGLSGRDVAFSVSGQKPR
jgi:hypothetical protein